MSRYHVPAPGEAIRLKGKRGIIGHKVMCCDLFAGPHLHIRNRGAVETGISRVARRPGDRCRTPEKEMKILLLDIETAPNLAYVWGLWKQNIAINQIENAGYVLSWAAKWRGEEEIMFDSVHRRRSSVTMLDKVHRLLDSADAVVHYNGKSFDIPTLQKEFVVHRMKPPAPYKQVDLLQIVKSEFRFPSNKLDYVAKALGLGTKVRHEGHELWTKCMRGEPEAWKRMEEYNRHDVTLLERLYDRLLPWIKIHPNHGAFSDSPVCPNCGSDDTGRRGTAVTLVMKYIRFQCRACGAWFRGNKSVGTNTDRRLPII